MELNQLISELDDLLETDAISDYCVNGLQVEGRPEVNRIVSGVSASRALFTKAIDHDADAVLVHHGILWNASSPPPITGSFKQRLRSLLLNDISLIAYHLPLDRHMNLGNAAQMASHIGLENLEPFGNHNGVSVGVCGVFPKPITLDELFTSVSVACNREPLIFAGDRVQISSVGIITGAAQRDYHDAVADGLDAYITGEATEWVMHQAAEDGVHYLAAGHYATETFGIRALGNWLERKHGLEVEFQDLPNTV